MRYLIALALLTSSMPLLAQETRPLPEDYQPPAATLDSAGWLVGHWQGPGIEGHQAHELWHAPIGNTMVGTFVQTDGAGNILFSEHMYLMEEAGTLVLRLKHFNADLTGWEDREGMVTFRLLELEHCRAIFGGLTIRCNGDGTLLIAVRMRETDGEVSELLFDLARAD